MIYSFYPDKNKEFSQIDISGTKYNPDLIEIEGIVSAHGGGISGTNGAKFRVHLFALEAWKIKNEESLNKQKLLIHRTIDPWVDTFFDDNPEPERDYFEDVPENSIVQLKVYLNNDKTRAIFESGQLMPLAENSVYHQVSEEISKPVEKSTATFGILKLERSMGSFSGQIDWNGKAIQLYFHTEENEDISEGLKTAEIIWKELSQWDQKAKSYAADELLETKNEAWLDEDDDGEEEQELTVADFTSRMSLDSFAFHPDGSFEFHYDNGDLFWGHSIEVWGDLNKGITHALFQG